MSLTPFTHFTHFETQHCVTGSMRHIYAHNNFDLSEDMLLGLGEGVGFIYWHQKGQPPFFGGRAIPKPSFEETVGERTGVTITPHTTASTHKAESALLDMLVTETPVMMQVDMGFLPYFDFGGHEYHFGGHLIVACGYDAATGQVLIADRDCDLHPVSLTDLAQARGSRFKPFSPQNRWYTFDFENSRLPVSYDIYMAIAHQTELMLNPPISNLGIKGIRKAAQLIPCWHESLIGDALKDALFNAYIFISPEGGTGGGLFRYMFSRFLTESAGITGNADLTNIANGFQSIADQWALLGEWFKDVAEDSNAPKRLSEVTVPLIAIAEREEVTWTHLQNVIQKEMLKV